jgi:hypothetical protein
VQTTLKVLVYFIGYILSTKTLPYQRHRNSRRLSEYYCKIINQERKGLNKERSTVFIKKGKCLLKKESLKIFQNHQSRFPCRSSGRPNASHKKLVFDTCPDDPLDVNHRELPFATCSNGLADTNHREHPFARMSKRKNENCGRRSFSLQQFGR